MTTTTTTTNEDKPVTGEVMPKSTIKVKKTLKTTPTTHNIKTSMTAINKMQGNLNGYDFTQHSTDELASMVDQVMTLCNFTVGRMLEAARTKFGEDKMYGAWLKDKLPKMHVRTAHRLRCLVSRYPSADALGERSVSIGYLTTEPTNAAIADELHKFTEVKRSLKEVKQKIKELKPSKKDDVRKLVDGTEFIRPSADQSFTIANRVILSAPILRPISLENLQAVITTVDEKDMSPAQLKTVKLLIATVNYQDAHSAWLEITADMNSEDNDVKDAKKQRNIALKTLLKLGK